MNKTYRIIGYNGGDNHFCGNCRTPNFAIQFVRKGKPLEGNELGWLIERLANGRAVFKEIYDKKTFRRYCIVIDKGWER